MLKAESTEVLDLLMGGELKSEVLLILGESVENWDVSQILSCISEISETIFSIILRFSINSEDVVGSDDLKSAEVESIPEDVVEQILEFHSLNLEWVIDFLWSSAGGNEPGLLAFQSSLSVDIFSFVIGPSVQKNSIEPPFHRGCDRTPPDRRNEDNVVRPNNSLDLSFKDTRELLGLESILLLF